MKNFKRAAAILGIVVLLAVCCLPMVFAFGSGENAAGMFRASLGMVILDMPSVILSGLLGAR